MLGTEREPRGVGNKRRVTEVEETMVYVPILQTLEVLLKNDCVAHEVPCIKCSPDYVHA